MAISVTLLHDGSTTTASTSYITPSLSPTAGRVLIAVAQLAGIGTATATSVSGLSGTWTNITGSNRYNTNYDLSVHVCTDYTGTGAVTFTNSDSATHAIVAVFEVSGANTTTPIVSGSLKTVSPGSVNSASITLDAAADADNRPFALWGCTNGTAGQAAPRASWTELTDRAVLTPNGVLQTQWRSDAHETTASVTWTGGPYITAGVAFEIAAAGGGGGSTGAALLRWTFNEGTGTVVADSTANGHDGTQAYFGAWNATGKYGACYENPSGGAWPATSDGTGIVDTSQPFTAAAWVYLTDNAQTRTAVGVTGSSTAAVQVGYRQSVNRWQFAMRTSDGGTEVAVTSSGAPALNTWTHLAAVYDGAGGMTLFVDGVSAGTGTLGSDWTYASNRVVVGEAGMTGVLDQWHGRVDDLWIFQEALSTAAIEDVMAGDAPATGLIATPAQAVEVDTAQPVSAGRSVTIGQAVEVNTAQPVTVAVPLHTLRDRFDDGVFDTGLWPGSYGGLTETGGVLRIDCDVAQWSAPKSAAIYQLAGSHTVMELTPPEPNTATLAYVSVLVTTATAGTDAGFNIDTATDGISYLVREAFSDPGAVFDTYDPVAHHWLRLREAAGTLYWETSPDGLTWTVRRSDTSPAWAASGGLALVVESHRDAGTDNYAELDNVGFAPLGATVGRAAEADTAGPVGAGGATAVRRVSEADTAGPVGAASATTVGRAAETDTATPVGAVRTAAVGRGAETDTAGPVGAASATTVGRAAETDTAGQISASVPVVPLPPLCGAAVVLSLTGSADVNALSGSVAAGCA